MTTKCGVILYNKQTKKYCLVFGRKSKKWGFPKGHQEDNENDITTARRELFEETGYELSDEILWKTKFLVKNNIYFEIDLENESQIRKKQSDIPDNIEIEKAEWFSFREILNIGIVNCNFGLKNWILKDRHIKSQH